MATLPFFSAVKNGRGTGATSADAVLAVVVFLFPAVYTAGWRPIVRMLIIWTMIAVLVILIRIPLPAELPELPLRF